VQNISSTRKDPSIVFIGAGPTGLMAATQIKLRKPTVSIKMLEKHQSYQRDNDVRLNANRFEQCEQDRDGIIADLNRELKAHSFIRIQELETKLKSLAEKLGIEIEIVPDGIKDVQAEVINRYPDARIIVGSDGAKSQFRDQVFPKSNFHREPLQYAAHVKYEVDGATDKLNVATELYPVLKRNTHHLANENVSKMKDGKTTISLQILIDQTTYDRLKNSATFKNPIRIFANGQSDVPANLVSDIKSLMGVRVINHQSRFDPASVRLSVTDIPQHYNDSILELRNGKFLVLLGDAAMGLSFFKSANAGLKSANKFAKIVADNWNKVENPRQGSVDDAFLAMARNTVAGETLSLPVDYTNTACILVNSILRSRVRLFEEDPTNINCPLITEFDTDAGIAGDAAHKKAQLISATYPLHDYAIWANEYAEEKIKKGTKTNDKLKLKEVGIDVSGKVPWQAIKFSSKQIDDFKDAVDSLISDPNMRLNYSHKSSFGLNRD
jgi:2-polyprenyl-6-methoxyphenol hydroxylase-like FAD-dependent oxidoreductase